MKGRLKNLSDVGVHILCDEWKRNRWENCPEVYNSQAHVFCDDLIFIKHFIIQRTPTIFTMINRAMRYGVHDVTSARDDRIEHNKIKIRNLMTMVNDAELLSPGLRPESSIHPAMEAKKIRPAWMEMAEIFITIGRFAYLEKSVPVQMEKHVSDQTGRKAAGLNDFFKS